MKKNRFNYFILGLVFTLSSCAEWLNVEPRQSVDSATALTSPEAITAATNAVYARLRQVTMYGRDFLAIPELLADNAFNTGAGNRLVGQFNNNPGAHMNNWQAAYFSINQINLIFEAWIRQPFVVDFENNIRGQLHFLRALIYHDLMRVYAYDPTAIIEEVNKGGVPLLTTGVLSVNQITLPARASIDEVYTFIYNDLEQAYGFLLPVGNTRRPHFATAGAAAALFSRVALYNGDYQRVIQQAELAFSSGTATFPSDAVEGWRAQVHPESFFEVVFTAPDNIGANESLRATFMTRTFLNDPNPASHGNVVFTDDLFAQFAADDLRQDLIQRGLGVNTNFRETNKFASKNGVPNLDNVPVIRFAEVITNKAEAHYHLGQFDLALQELNRVRTRAGLEALSGLAGPEILEEILIEKRREFCFEGHRFFDLKRLGRDIVKEFGVIEFNDFRILNNIPNREIEINPNLEQNRGY
ncbi:RagB/SusD domain-containing protein [Nitritalea halalkaliphila LW7]|uniref:RagB/SusD domain-containing protein n=1 Tax=Nitritalea halalkaliphila LW7 TaxID=1189621 RepID=I5BZW4_9BACT|nr:RagB/SusD family nutrient uptake outer membrane protein [Nitritalea halalkaliphila]EIM75116.1 RagB/SusD domain-containing protein [Nitritalea halalkaliphila LW7]